MRTKSASAPWGSRVLGMGLVLLGCGQAALAIPPSQQVRAWLAAGRKVDVIVEVDATAADAAADAERSRRHLRYDDAAILAMRASGYVAARSPVTSGVSGKDAQLVRDYQHFPLSVWRISSLDALARLRAYPGVRAVHQNSVLHTVSVSDLPFINAPQAAAEGATGAGTTVAVIDGGLDSSWTSYSDFGTCTAVGTPANTCRVVYNYQYNPSGGASSETLHGTNVSAIALGVAPGANLAMFNVFNGTGTTTTNIIDALDDVLRMKAQYDIVAVNMSLGDNSSNSTQCGSTVSPFVQALSALEQAGIIPVIAAGNSGSKTGLADPACVAGVVSVGAVYDASYGTITWPLALPSAPCTDVSAADKVTCFSQSASYLTLLAPGTFVNAPNSSFQESGTSQATPHVTGSIAVLRARYPAETTSETVQRLQVSGVTDTDSANGRSTPRINLLAAVNQGTAVALSGSGPTQAVSGGTGTYTITVTNNGPLAATNVAVTDTLPSLGSFLSASSGCTYNYPSVTCSVGSLAAGASVTLTITVTWTGSGAVYNSATVNADQSDTSTQQTLAMGTASTAGNAPLPGWAYALLAVALSGLALRESRGFRSTSAS
ncbi:MAG TPA: S8 family serine peptidase [Steroidobacteraceae bacterium]|nr:S8 family serine peptidase [Steroidobacteraceae bacterium]